MSHRFPAAFDGTHSDVLVVGGGSAGVATAASLARRRPDLKISIVEPKGVHDYQPGWTLVGAGVFRQSDTQRPMLDVIPKGVTWIQGEVVRFEPDQDRVVLGDGRRLGYRVLIAAPGLILDWDAIDGLRDTLGRNGVTSNYVADLAPYTWELVQSLKQGRALFTQAPMPIKCAGAPQKAMYLSCDHWRRNGRQNAVQTEFHSAAAVLFGVAAYVPALMAYIRRYGVALNLQSRLISVDGPSRRATFSMTDTDGGVREVTRTFDVLHVCPPQKPPAAVAGGPLADAAGWIDVDRETLRHLRHANVFAAGDACNAPSAKTAAAARRQAPVAAENAIAVLEGHKPRAVSDGYSSCPLTVERGKVVLAEFGYDGKLLPTFPPYLLNGEAPTALAWHLMARALPHLYWSGMLKGREWLARPAFRDASAL